MEEVETFRSHVAGVSFQAVCSRCSWDIQKQNKHEGNGRIYHTFPLSPCLKPVLRCHLDHLDSTQLLLNNVFDQKHTNWKIVFCHHKFSCDKQNDRSNERSRAPSSSFMLSINGP